MPVPVGDFNGSEYSGCISTLTHLVLVRRAHRLVAGLLNEGARSIH